MRRTALMLASMALGVLLVCGVALAATISCPNRAGNLCVGTAQDDTMTGTDTSDVMKGARGNDTINALGGDDRLSGELGDDTLRGAEGNDTYVVGTEVGRDRIPDGGETAGVDTVDLTAAGSSLDCGMVDLGAGFAVAASFDRTLEWSSEVIIENVRGGARCDHITGNNAANRLNGNRLHDRISGLGGNDYLSGGPDDDFLNGGGGNDTLRGWDDSDDYIFEGSSWGSDTIIDDAPSSFDNFAQFDGGTQALTIDLNSSPGAPEVINASGEGRVNWSGNVIDRVAITAPVDANIVGNPNDNSIGSGHGGIATVSAGAGDDTIYVGDGSGGDVVRCGEDGPGVTDNDWVYLDPGDTAINCETQNL